MTISEPAAGHSVSRTRTAMHSNRTIHRLCPDTAGTPGSARESAEATAERSRGASDGMRDEGWRATQRDDRGRREARFECRLLHTHLHPLLRHLAHTTTCHSSSRSPHTLHPPLQQPPLSSSHSPLSPTSHPSSLPSTRLEPLLSLRSTTITTWSRPPPSSSSSLSCRPP